LKETPNNKILDAALYAKLGWGIIPLHTPTENGCSCGRRDCSSIGKHPRTQHGLKDGTVDQATIRAWWGQWPNANIGIVTGAVSGLVVLDQDGPEAEETLKDKHLPPTPCAFTGQGVHRYFAHPGKEVRNFARKLPGLDLRGDGGYVVAPPSLHVSGRRYEWAENLSPEDIELAPCPEWLLELVQEKRYDRRTLPDGDIPEGQRNDTLASFAGSMRKRGMSEGTILAALRSENQARCVPPLQDPEVVAIVESIAQYPPAPEIVEPPKVEINPRPVGELIPDVCRFFDGDIDGLPSGFPALDRKLMGLRGLVLLGAPPKVGKSTFFLNIGLHVAREIYDAGVICFDVENGQNIIMARLLSNFYGLTIEQLRKRYKAEWEIWQADLEEKLPNFYLYTDYSLMRPDVIARRIQDVETDKKLLVLDSLQKLPPLAKQRRDSIDTWLRELEQIKQDSSVTILLVSELSRGEGGKHYQRPHLVAFKESGDVEYTADVALQFTEAKVKGHAALHVVANRHGESGFIGNYSYRDFKYWRWTEVPM